MSERKKLSASEHPWKYGLISGLVFGAALFLVLYLERPSRAVVPLVVLTGTAGSLYAVVLAQVHGKWLKGRNKRGGAS
jgi:hypothetical protein